THKKHDNNPHDREPKNTPGHRSTPTLPPHTPPSSTNLTESNPQSRRPAASSNRSTGSFNNCPTTSRNSHAKHCPTVHPAISARRPTPAEPPPTTTPSTAVSKTTSRNSVSRAPSRS